MAFEHILAFVAFGAIIAGFIIGARIRARKMKRMYVAPAKETSEAIALTKTLIAYFKTEPRVRAAYLCILAFGSDTGNKALAIRLPEATAHNDVQAMFNQIGEKVADVVEKGYAVDILLLGEDEASCVIAKTIVPFYEAPE